MPASELSTPDRRITLKGAAGPHHTKVAIIVLAHHNIIRRVEVDALAAEIELGEAPVLPPVLHQAGPTLDH